MRPVVPRPRRSASFPSSSVSSGSSGSFCRERERSPRTPLPPPAPMPAPEPVYPIPRTSMLYVRRYRSLFSRRRVAPPTPPSSSPPPSDEEPSEGTVDPAAELEGDPEEPYLEDFVYPAGYDADGDHVNGGGGIGDVFRKQKFATNITQRIHAVSTLSSFALSLMFFSVVLPTPSKPFIYVSALH
ncbi:hypothetical protein PIB30_043411 [Stylosanthes scabra]|uniref:Uncharacterized protein n=1 Tax=Stylosanthes scabra TaxID=79078 RepID=A0ABU6SFP0_9FABA|nr:hypothetical protein [Stylosanthes scabra]